MTPLPIPESPVCTRIAGCTDIPQLDRRVDRAMTATSLHEVFAASDGAE